jgi:hypothetical protein
MCLGPHCEGGLDLGVRILDLNQVGRPSGLGLGGLGLSPVLPLPRSFSVSRIDRIELLLRAPSEFTFRGQVGGVIVVLKAGFVW